MSEFKMFSKLVKARFDALSSRELFTVTISGDDLWAAYLAAFPEGTNPIFRQRTEHDCSCCRNFIKNLGRVVAFVDGTMQTVWDIDGLPEPYNVVAAELHNLIMRQPVNGIYRTKERSYGLAKNFEEVEGQGPIVWNHFHGTVPSHARTDSPEAAIGDYASKAQVFGRGLKELDPTAVSTVLDLIQSNNLYRGEENQHAVASFLALQEAYWAEPESQRQDFVWQNAGKPGALIRNTAIGTLLIDLSEGVELERAVKSFEDKVSGTNYKRPTALITPRMVEDAMKTIGELGLEPALQRRHAKLSDVSINNVIWADSGAQAEMKGGLAAALMSAAKEVPVNEKQVQLIGIADFMKDVVPHAAKMAVKVCNGQQGNLMSITTAAHGLSEQIFKWNNHFAWSYNGNLADSIKDKVKRAGGNVSAALRISLAWYNPDDLDLSAHCPDGHVYFGQKRNILDVDMNAHGPSSATEPVENLSWSNPRDGQYQIVVNQYHQRSSDRQGYTLEIENNGLITQFTHAAPARGAKAVFIFNVVGGVIQNLKVDSGLVGGGLEQEVWGIKTERFVPVQTLMYSPNHWDGQAVGNKHYFFILEGAKNPEPIRGIYNEFLINDLDKHRKVFEVLGNKTMCPVADEQLSGIGFSSTRADEVLVEVTGLKTKRVYKVQF